MDCPKRGSLALGQNNEGLPPCSQCDWDGEWSKRPRHPLPKKVIEVTEHDACVMRHALVQRQKAVRVEVEVLKLTRDRELTREERWLLPANLQTMTRAELQEQVDAWISLLSTIEFWIEEFKVGHGEGKEEGADQVPG